MVSFQTVLSEEESPLKEGTSFLGSEPAAQHTLALVRCPSDTDFALSKSLSNVPEPHKNQSRAERKTRQLISLIAHG